MRPGRIRPGNPTARFKARATVTGFNEAGADPPRKPGARERSDQAVGGCASMRPGRIRPGNLSSQHEGVIVIYDGLQ